MITKILAGVTLSLFLALAFTIKYAKGLHGKNERLKVEIKTVESALKQSQDAFEKIKKEKEKEIEILTKTISKREGVIHDYEKFKNKAKQDEINCVNESVDPSLVMWMLNNAKNDSDQRASENPPTRSSDEALH